MNITMQIGTGRKNRSSREFKGESLINIINNYTIIDIETTGLDPNANEIIELAAIKVRDSKIVDTYSQLIHPKNPIEEFITNLTGISNEMVKEAPIIETAIKDYLKFIDDDIIIGHNVNFDINFLYDNSISILNTPLENDFIDTLRLSKKCLILDNYKLKTLAKHYNISYEGAHRALKDCYITFDLYNNIKDEIRKIEDDSKDILDNFLPPTNNIFENKNIVFKGTYKNYDYNFYEEIAKKCNVRRVDCTFWNNTDYIILGYKMFEIFSSDGGGEVICKARKMQDEGKLKVLSEDEFCKLNNLPLISKVKNKKTSKDFIATTNDIPVDNPFYQKECVFTGTLEKMDRNEARQIIANLGGINKDGITKNTNYLILGNTDYNPILRGKKSSKLIKAEQMKLDGKDIEILSENVFYDIINDFYIENN